MSNACVFTVLNNSPYVLSLEKQVVEHGTWDKLPPVVIEHFSIRQFRLAPPLSGGYEQYHGTEGYVVYVSNDPYNSQFRVYCNNPYQGASSASISNPLPEGYSTSFKCAEDLPFTKETVFEQKAYTSDFCPATQEDLQVQYQISKISGRQLTREPEISKNGSSYIKISNYTPYKLTLAFQEEVLGYWEKEPHDVIQPFSSTDWSHLAGDIAAGEASKGVLVYSFAINKDQILKWELSFYNPSDKVQNDTCRISTAQINCTGIDLNAVRVLDPKINNLDAYYECGTDINSSQDWTTNYCEKTSDVLYVHYHLTEVE